MLYLTKSYLPQMAHKLLQQGECISSYYMKALFASVPVDPAISIIKTN